MVSIMYNNNEYCFEDFAYKQDGTPSECKCQLFGVVLDNQIPSVIGALYGEYEGLKSWLPMKWDLFTGKHFDCGYNLQATP